MLSDCPPKKSARESGSECFNDSRRLYEILVFFAFRGMFSSHPNISIWAKRFSENRKFTGQCAKASGKERSPESKEKERKTELRSHFIIDDAVSTTILTTSISYSAKTHEQVGNNDDPGRGICSLIYIKNRV